LIEGGDANLWSCSSLLGLLFFVVIRIEHGLKVFGGKAASSLGVSFLPDHCWRGYLRSGLSALHGESVLLPELGAHTEIRVGTRQFVV